MWWAWTAGTGWGAELRVGPTQPYVTLNAALEASFPGDVIRIDPGRYTEDTDLIDVVGVEIIGGGSDPVTGTIFAGGSGPSQWHVERSSFTVRDLAIDGENLRRTLTLIEDSAVDAWNLRISRGSQATGAGITVVGSALSLHGSLVDANVSGGPGGGLHAVESAILLEDTVFSANAAGAEGGAVWIGSGAELDLVRGSIVDNAGRFGAGLACASAARCAVDGATFERNIASEGGGAVYLYRVPNATVLRAAFCENVAATASGGALNLFESTATVENATFLENRAEAHGGGLLANGSVLNLQNSTFFADSAGGRGGAFYQTGDSSTRSVNNLFVGSSSDGPPFAAVDIQAGVRSGGWDLYFANVADASPATLPNDWLGEDPLLALAGTCVAPAPADPGPAIDAGDPQILDPDESRSDIGATGGPDAQRDRDGDGAWDGEDCNDIDPDQTPGQPEDCDGVDDDCDGVVDEDCAGPVTGPRDAGSLGPETPAPGCGCRATGSAGPSAVGWLALAIRGCRRRRGRSPRS